MTIEKIEPIHAKKKKVIMQDGRCFALYNSEIYRYKLSEGEELSEELYGEIGTVLKKRAKERLMGLLKNRDYTEYQLRAKLRQGFYPEDAIESAIQYGKEHHYIDDLRYARLYVEQKGNSVGRRMLCRKLSEKGIEREIVEQVIEDQGDEEEAALEALIRKKNIDFSVLSWQERQKICAYFMRKGFTYENILKKINEISGTDYLT